MKEFVRDNVVFVGKGSRLDPLNQRCTIVEDFPSNHATGGECHQIMLSLDEAERLRAYLSAWLQEQEPNG